MVSLSEYTTLTICLISGVQSIQQLLQAKGFSAELHLLETISDPTDHAALLYEMGRVVKDVRSVHGDENLTVLVSPGTPQMQAVWLILTNDGRLPARLFQRKENDYGGDVVQVAIEPLFESRILSSAVDMMRGYDFFAAKQQLDILVESSYSLDRRIVCELVAQVCEVLHLWSIFEYRKALETYKESVEPSLQYLCGSDTSSAVQHFKDQLIDARTTLGRLNANNGELVVQDLLWSAQRFLNTGRYIDCVWRCRTLYEVMLRRALLSRSVHYSEEGDIRSAEDRLLGHAIEGFKIKGKPVKLPGLAQADAGMTAILDNKELYDKLVEINRIRNQAIHDGRFCSSEQTKSGFDATKMAVEVFYDLSTKGFEKNLLSPVSVQRFVETVQSVLQSKV